MYHNILLCSTLALEEFSLVLGPTALIQRRMVIVDRLAIRSLIRFLISTLAKVFGGYYNCDFQAQYHQFSGGAPLD